MGPTRLAAVLFDLDGVIVNTFAYWLTVMNRAAVHYRAPAISAEDLRRTWGQSLQEDIRDSFPGHEAAELEEFYRNEIPELVELLKVAPKAAAVLATLHRGGLATGLVTNASGFFARTVVEHGRLSFDVLVTAEDVGRPKPAPVCVQLACGRLSVRPSRALFVGDSPFDQKAAVAAGAHFAGIGDQVHTGLKLISLTDLLHMEAE
ncbi:HAD family hydrolase [Streptomyces agglomeratus]|nr:HAD-IA family hydrolase [Streptomyces agglomeratus]